MQKSKYSFYLNPHEEYKWTKCPKCDNHTKLRKFCLFIHYQEKSVGFNQLISLNIACKLCPSCELIIAQKSEIEANLSHAIPSFGLEFNADNYFIFGTLDRKDFRKSQKEPLSQRESLEIVFRFKNIWYFDIKPAGWYFEGK